jgi:hypothetical protein
VSLSALKTDGTLAAKTGVLRGLTAGKFDTTGLAL